MKKVIWSLAVLFISCKLNAQIWWPDTCDCAIEVDQSFQFIKFIKPCDAYSNLADQDAFDTILAENQLKNQTVDYIMQTYPDKLIDSDPLCIQAQNLWEIAVVNQPDLAPPTCQTTKVIPDFTFSYDDNRTLMINTPALTDQEMNDVGTEIQTQMQSKSLGLKNIQSKLGINISK